MGRSWMLAMAGFCLLALGLLGFTPFTKIEGVVCEDCPIPGYDMMHMTDGTKHPVRILAKLDEFYIVERFGEYRTVELEAVERTEMNGERAEFNRLDVVITTSGYVVAGKIIEDQAGRFVRIAPWNATTAPVEIWYTQIERVYKGERRHHG